jgi:hypothetical protein
VKLIATEVTPPKVRPPVIFTKVEIINAFTTRIPFIIIAQLNADIIYLSHLVRISKIELLDIISHCILKDFKVFLDIHLNQIMLTKTDKRGKRLSDKVYTDAEKVILSGTFNRRTGRSTKPFDNRKPIR